MKKLVYYFALLCGVLLAVSCTKDKATDGNGSDYFVGTWDCEWIEDEGVLDKETDNLYLTINENTITYNYGDIGAISASYSVDGNVVNIIMFGMEVQYNIYEKDENSFIWGYNNEKGNYKEKYIRRK